MNVRAQLSAADSNTHIHTHTYSWANPYWV